MKRLAVAGAIRLSICLKDRLKPEIFNEYTEILYKEAEPEMLKNLEEPENYTGDDVVSERLKRILESLEGCELALTAFELAALRYYYPAAGEVFDYVVKGVSEGVTLELACKVNDFMGGIIEHTTDIIEAYDRLYLIMLSNEEKSDIARILLRFDFRLASHFSGKDMFDAELLHYCDRLIPDTVTEVFGYREELDEFIADVDKYYTTLEENGHLQFLESTIVFSGAKESGRTVSACRFCSSLGITMFSVEYDFLAKSDHCRLLLNKLLRECYLLDAALCVRNIKSTAETPDILCEIRKAYGMFGSRPLILLTDPEEKPLSYLKGRIFSFKIPELSPVARQNAWSKELELYGIQSEIDTCELSAKMALTVGQIERSVCLIKNLEDSGKRCTTRLLYDICYSVLDDGRYNSIKRVNSGFALNDLKIPEKDKDTLRAVCDQINYRYKVLNEWNMIKKYPYGRCVSLLLAGPPGTGKTMAVHALSNELGLELYKVDLSQIADKYIGETEKRLEEVFDRASKTNMILFFDEADSVMGKRSETKDAHDKYANNEISFILQRMEEFDGIVILATNYLQNIDSAFMRRIRYVINFTKPEVSIRKELWQSAIADEVPVSDEIDYDFLAENFELAGGNIKNIVLNATFLAAAEGSVLSMKHIIRAVAQDNNKDSRVSFTYDFGPYARYLLY